MQAWARPDVPSLTRSPGRPRVFDTRAGRLVPVGPERGTARLYVCGITPYDATHLGHANTYVAFDLLVRAWLDAGLLVDYAQNVTDVDDPLLERAAATGVDWAELAASQIELFRTDMVALRVVPPQHYRGVVESMDTIVAAVDHLRARGDAYPADDPEYPDWYFAGEHLGDVSGLSAAEALPVFAERGGDPDRPGKRDSLDSLLWRLARPGEPSWPAPMGRGRPGWHIECAAIAQAVLGATVDVQGGGSDLVYPHHEHSAAQAHALSGQDFARAYVHAGMVGYQGEKMSKSRGNLVLVSQLRAAGHDPMAIRLVLLAHHYRTDWEYTDADLAAAEARLAAWRDAVRRPTGPAASATVARLRESLRDDLDAPRALAAMDAWSAAPGDDAEAPAAVAAAVDALLGVRLG
nr:cysteine--1-D-myo-inosityl 2-amino-2-deoxy-alpha-D-glucopyranoside ligase [Propionibacterium sp.]